jgi:hypothetical protein
MAVGKYGVPPGCITGLRPGHPGAAPTTIAKRLPLAGGAARRSDTEDALILTDAVLEVTMLGRYTTPQM